jgi:2-desacetyl-2-hydroxyethyl bacteriochlorophyllide A dehydrogenase
MSSLGEQSGAVGDAYATSLWFPRAGEVELRREPMRVPLPTEVRVRAMVSAISHGTEMLVYHGQIPRDLDLDLPTLQGSFRFPIKYGYASVGRVVEVGEAVKELCVGDLVFALHPHQTEYVVPGSWVVRLPTGLDPESGVFLANVETAVNVLLDAAPRLGERVVIFGQGVVGLVLTQLARRAGANLVIAVEPRPKRQAVARLVGADMVLSPDEHVREEIHRLTAGVGADIVLEASGSGSALAQALDCTAAEGTIVVCSWYGTKPVTLPLGGAFHRGRLHIVSSQVGAINPALQPRWSRERRLALARDLLPTLQLTSLITHRIPFARAAEAYTLVDRHSEEVLQVILTYESGDV